jgi:hypothetical protein
VSRSRQSRPGSASPIKACIARSVAIASRTAPTSPNYAYNQAYLWLRRPKPRVFATQPALPEAVAAKLGRRWSTEQIVRWLRRRYPRRRVWQVCVETVYDAVYRRLILPVNAANLRTSRTYRHRRGRGHSRDGAPKQCTMRSFRERPAVPYGALLMLPEVPTESGGRPTRSKVREPSAYPLVTTPSKRSTTI